MSGPDAGVRSGRLGRIWAATRLIAAKDLRLEWRSRVVIAQVLPFALVVMVIFAFALDAKAVRFVEVGGATRSIGLLPLVAPGLIWLTVLFSVTLLVQRSFATEAEDGAVDALRLAGVSPAAIYWGKTIAVGAELMALTAVATLLGVVLYQVEFMIAGLGLLVVTVLLGVIGFAEVGVLYGAFTTRAQGSTIVPLLVFPATAPIMIAATRATESAFQTDGVALAEGWPWIGLLTVYTIVLGVGSSLAFGPLTEEAR